MKTLEATCYFHQNRIYVKPAEGTYEMIYRAACGVYWDEEEKALYFLDDPTNYQLSLKHIVLAMKNEYYIDLIITNTFMQCDCNERYATEINSITLFEELKVFFGRKTANGVFIDERPTKPYYIWDDGSGHIEYFADKWYRCKSCGCLWEFNYPDFPKLGWVKKYEDGNYTGTDICIYQRKDGTSALSEI